MQKFVNKNIRMAADDLPLFDQTFQESGCSSQGEFQRKLLEKWNEPEKIAEPQTEIRTVHVEKQLLANEILLGLTPAQEYALRQTILSIPDFAEKQNEIIDSIKVGDRPFMYFGNLFAPEFQNVWVRSIPIVKTMTTGEKENAVRANMSAFLVNMFMMHIIEGRISATKVDAESLKEFIRNSAKPKILNPQSPEPCKTL